MCLQNNFVKYIILQLCYYKLMILFNNKLNNFNQNFFE